MSSGNPPFYAGSSLVLTCQSTLLTTSLYSGTISAAITWKRNHTALVLNESATVVQTNEGLVYTSTLTLSGLSYIRHSGPIMCEVMTTTPDGYTSLSVTSDSLDLNVQGKYKLYCKYFLSLYGFLYCGIHFLVLWGFVMYSSIDNTCVLGISFSYEYLVLRI